MLSTVHAYLSGGCPMMIKKIATVLTFSLLLMCGLQGCSEDKSIDEKITESVKSKIAGEPSLASAKVVIETKDQIVTLTGTIDSPIQEQTLKRVTHSVDGVKKVDSKVTIHSTAHGSTTPAPTHQEATQ
jgi:hypothetical protein